MKLELKHYLDTLSQTYTMIFDRFGHRVVGELVVKTVLSFA